MKPLRSILYVPASNQRALQKATTLQADGFIFDLEDAVCPFNKNKARQTLVNALDKNCYIDKFIAIRVNGFKTNHCMDDLQAVCKHKIDAIVFPKIESCDEIKKANHLMEYYRFCQSVVLWAMIETPKGILACQSIASCDTRLDTLVLGTSDLSKELTIEQSPDRLGLLHALSHCVMCAKTYKLNILDGVSLNLEDKLGFINACKQGKQLGFDGKTLINPRQITDCNKAFSPSKKEVLDANNIIDLWQTMKKEKQGVAVYQGRLIEYLHVEQAYHTLNRANQLENIN
jgi:citrate lyase subunit beta / citryl-CoA lyase